MPKTCQSHDKGNALLCLVLPCLAWRHAKAMPAAAAPTYHTCHLGPCRPAPSRPVPSPPFGAFAPSVFGAPSAPSVRLVRPVRPSLRSVHPICPASSVDARVNPFHIWSILAQIFTHGAILKKIHEFACIAIVRDEAVATNVGA